eukprot:TRINITY_DN62937_c0_g1_i1.p2 TRINITY_DN62937_c0_g1~~TRINITY_DN62937_c0_g1_i1.p2  ORF type:complete len:101 (+),score=30.28 TRINITY_DN62937_c0_g1_i1:119-421(+)
MLRSLVGSEMCIRDRYKASQIMPSMEHVSEQQEMSNGSRPEWAEPLFRMKDTVEVCTGEHDDPSSWHPAVVVQCTPGTMPVSYTHLTLPTKRIVEISGFA